jgi:TATA-box binding protein (TBP) (component of TFIID and TFIIIB)
MTTVATNTSISTTVCLSSVGCPLDLEIIFYKLPLDDCILGIKYHNRYKGQVKETGSFFNQATIVMYIKEVDKQVNLKIFTNGNIQITGVKSENQVTATLETFISKINDIKGQTKIKVTCKDQIIYNKEEYNLFITEKHTRFDCIHFYNDDGKVIGERKGNDFVIFLNDTRENVTTFMIDDETFFLQKKHSANFCKNIYNRHSELVGYTQYLFRRKRKNLIIAGNKFIDDLKVDTSSIENQDSIKDCIKSISIYDRYNNFIGKQLIFITIKKEILLKSLTIIDDLYSNYSALLGVPLEKFNINTININCNFGLVKNGIPIDLDRGILHHELVNKYKIISYYDPSGKYQAINVKLYFDENNKIVDNVKNDSLFKFKCTAMIFKNGKILLAGCKNVDDINIVKDYILKIFNEEGNHIFNKNLVKEKITIINENITIYDLL